MKQRFTKRKRNFFSLKCLFTLASIVLFSGISYLTNAQDATSTFWMDISESTISTDQVDRVIIPNSYRTMSLDVGRMKDYLRTVPMEFSADAATRGSYLSLPLPNGTYLTFSIVESPIMEAELARKYPDIKTYLGQGVEDKTATLRFDLTPLGFHAMIRSVDGSIFIDPYSLGNITDYIIYYGKDFESLPGDVFIEDWNGEDPPKRDLQDSGSDIGGGNADGLSHGTHLRTFRLALAADFEYVAYFGGTKALAIAAMNTTMNRVNQVYEAELAIRMLIVAGNDALVYDVKADDPYPEDGACDLRDDNQTNIDNVIGNANYDIGHLFAIGSGGCAIGNSVCNPSFKAYGVTGLANPVGDPFDIDYVCHEMGHQFNASHTWNGNSGSCTAGQYVSHSAYEPGSASTIMGYAGICGGDDLQSNSDPYFHTRSFDQIVTYITSGGGTCAMVYITGNDPPTVDAGPGGYIIPISTPFELTGTGSDPNGDAITFCWEEYDLGPQGDPGSPSGNAPIFRSFNPVTSPTRVFPKLSDLLANTTTIGEILPTYSRDLNFRLTVRDNKAPSGGVSWDDMSMQVSSAAGPFLVTSPNTSSVEWCEGESVTITWIVAGTDADPVSCSHVDILLSRDGGYTYPVILASNTPNDGTESITLPTNTVTSTARVKVKGFGNVFFDISNFDFIINAPPVFTDQPDDLSVDWGDAASFTIDFTGTPTPTIQWEMSNDGGIVYDILAGETLKTLSFSCVSYDYNGNKYRAKITNDCESVYSDVATLTVSQPITSEPDDVSAEFCDDVSFTVGYNGTPGIQWYESTDGGFHWIAISGETSSTLNLYEVSLDMDGNMYQAVLSVDCENVYTRGATLTVVPKVTTPAITVLPNPQQYSDLVDITVVIADGYACSEYSATGADIYIGATFLGTIAFSVSGPDLTAALNDVALVDIPAYPPSGDFAPGPHTVTADLLEVNPNFDVYDPSTTLNIDQEDARAYYTGAFYASTQGVNSDEAIVTLSATIKDITAVDPGSDPDAGDIRNASISFVDRDGGIVATAVPVGLVDPNDPTVGVGTTDWNVTISGDAEDFTIGVVVYDYYTRNSSEDDIIVTVAKPLPNFVTGGGYITLESPAGIVAGDVGSKNNFGFNVRFNKNGTNLRGKVNTIIRKTEWDGVHTYQIKGNKITSLAIIPDDEGGEATINCKASIEDITDPMYPVSIEGNASMQINMDDNGEPGDNDLIAITIWDKWDGLWYASNWDGTRTAQQLLDGGNLAVHSDGSFKSFEIVNNEIEPGDELRIAPNPNTGQFTLMFLPELLFEARVLIMDMRGNVVDEFLLNSNEIDINMKGSGPGIYQVNVFNGGEMYKTKVVIK